MGLRDLFKAKHECDLPTGVIFEPEWTCPTCGVVWVYHGQANYSVWMRRDDGTT